MRAPAATLAELRTITPGDRQPARQPGQRVRRSLAEQLPVGVGADTGPQPVHGHRGEQALHAGDHRHGHRAGPDPDPLAAFG
ncbi:hypothetical protein GCM10017691_20430 [Pseudonocardia petroleophila]